MYVEREVGVKCRESEGVDRESGRCRYGEGVCVDREVGRKCR